ncbi:acyl-CoA N-acyltransferase [Crassisporium funariophilum]|nr:acyl-CoA N-acyltransferase [Crassisporium funariophilum]
MGVPPHPYNHNFCYPLPESLENERTQLVPFIPSKHAHIFMKQAPQHPEIFSYVPFGPFKDVDDFVVNFFEVFFERKTGNTLFAVFDKTKPQTFDSGGDGTTEKAKGEWPLAGLIGLINSHPENLVTEIGAVLILPPFQRTHVASNAVGLLLQYSLNLPSAVSPGLGLRRVVWLANARNKPSIRLAERMGFTLEGILRWDRVLPPGKGNGTSELRDGDPRKGCSGRDTATLAFCWDDWEDGGREKVDAIMARVV